MVLHDHDSSPTGRRGRRVQELGAGRGNAREAYRESAAAAEPGTGHLHGPAVKLDETLDQGKAEPQTSTGPINRLRPLDEELEDAL